MSQKDPWELLSDKTMWDYLSDVNQPLSEDYLRMLFVELLSRIRHLEYENYTMKIILFESELVDEKIFSDALTAVRDFMKQRDEKKAKEVAVFAGSGISFTDWVNFTLHGKFNED